MKCTSRQLYRHNPKTKTSTRIRIRLSRWVPSTTTQAGVLKIAYLMWHQRFKECIMHAYTHLSAEFLRSTAGSTARVTNIVASSPTSIGTERLQSPMRSGKIQCKPEDKPTTNVVGFQVLFIGFPLKSVGSELAWCLLTTYLAI